MTNKEKLIKKLTQSKNKKLLNFKATAGVSTGNGGCIIMQNIKKEILTGWEKETQKIANAFVLEVFGEDYLDDMYWVADHIGSVLCVGDHFIDMYRIIEYYAYNATPEQFFEYYDWDLEKEPPVSFRNFIKYGKEIK